MSAATCEDLPKTGRCLVFADPLFQGFQPTTEDISSKSGFFGGETYDVLQEDFPKARAVLVNILKHRIIEMSLVTTSNWAWLEPLLLPFQNLLICNGVVVLFLNTVHLSFFFFFHLV